MAAIFIELDEAAKQLGVTAEQLNEMRLRGEIYGTRDGSTWKFKVEEVQRVAEERRVASSDEGDDDVFGLDSDADSSSSDLHLEAEAEISSDSPTAIGSVEDLEDLGVDTDDAKPDEDDDELRLQPEGGSDVALVPNGEGSGVNLVADGDDDIFAGSDINLEAEGTGDLDFEGSGLSISSDVSLDDAKPDVPGAEITVDDDDELALSDDDELVIDGGSDVTGGSGGSGINLKKPSDSGLNLEEEPLDLAGSSVSSLELPEDDDIIDLDELDAGDESTELKADEDFQLTASAMMGEEDEEDSGSQVIALEDSEAFGDDAGMLAEEAEPVLGESQDELEDALDQYETSPAIQPTAQTGYAPLPEAQYSLWNILALLAVFVILGLTGMLMMDLVRNMWTWGETYTASTPIMDMMVRLVGLDP